MVFSHNTGFYGGAIALSNSQVHCESGASILFDGNMACMEGRSIWLNNFFSPASAP